MNPNRKFPGLVFVLLGMSASVAGVSLQAQSATAATDAAQAARDLARYDTNHNGKLDPDELAAKQADEAKAANAPVASAPGASAPNEAVRLSPFEVKEDTNGYYAANTMSGTRLNSKIEDLGSAISVVTKAEMTDFAMLDLNDIFSYQASTEGTGNFTDFSIDRNGMVTDNIQNNPQGANRVRGIGAANIALDNFATSGRVPLDPIGIDGVEISRGPNSNIFGLGTGSGTVNLLAASASLNRETSAAEARVDSLGGYRASLDLNRPLIKGKLAVRASIVDQHDAYNEKPSGGTTHRLNFMLRAQPFQSTSIRASFQNYDYFGSRAGSITPRDGISYWRATGSPTWDPIANAVTVGGVTTVMTTTANPATLANPTFSDPVLYVDNGGIQLWQSQKIPTFTTGTTVLSNSVFGIPRLLEPNLASVRTGRPLFATVPGINNKALFDWSKISLAGINSIKDHNETSTVQLEQYFLNSEVQQFAVQAGWNREHALRFNKNISGQSSATGNSNYIYIDVNSKLLDGSANPYFLRPYLESGEPVFNSTPYQRDTARAQAVYKLDLTTQKSWLKWLGRHSILGYGEDRETKSYAYRFRDVITSDNPNFAPAGVPKGNQSGTVAPIWTRPYFHFYLGDKSGNITTSPSAYAQGNYNFSWLNPATNQWTSTPVTLGESAIQEGAGGTFGSENLLKTHGVVIQDAVLDDRVIFTGGRRHDDNNNKFQQPSVLNPDGYTYNYAAFNGFVRDWAKGAGDTTTEGWVFKPFRGWRSLNEAAGSGGAAGFFANLLRGFDVHYNKSDSFLPSTPAVTVTLEQLPNPTSNGKDYGFSLNLWNDKLVLRANRYTTNQINTQNGQFGTFGQRTLRMDIQNFAGNADAISLQRQARNWVSAANPGFSTAQVDDAVYKIMGLTAAQVATFNSNAIGETQDITAKGDELEVNYNPDHFWTVKVSVTKTQSINANIAPHITAWVAQRMPIWTSIIDPRVGTPWFTTAYSGDLPTTGTGTPAAFLQGNIVAPIQLAQATQGKPLPEVREWHYNASASVRLAKYTEQKYLKNMSVGGSVRWESQGAIGYFGIPVNGDITQATQFDPNRPIYSKGNTYLDAFATYNTRLFHDKVHARFQLNVRNLQEWKAHLTPVAAYPDGNPNTFRIIEPMSFILTSTFDL